MQRIHIRNLFQLLIPFKCPDGAKLFVIPDSDQNHFGFLVKDKDSAILYKFQLELFIVEENSTTVFKVSKKDCLQFAGRKVLSIQEPTPQNKTEGILTNIRVPHGVFDFRKIREGQLPSRIAVNCYDGAGAFIQQGVTPIFLLWKKKRAGEADIKEEDNQAASEYMGVTWMQTPIINNVATSNNLETKSNEEANPAQNNNNNLESIEDSPNYSINNNTSDSYISPDYYQASIESVNDDEAQNYQERESRFASYPDPIVQLQPRDERYMTLYKGNAEVIGNFRALNFYKASDLRIKQEIRRLIEDYDCRDVLLQIDGVSYKFRPGVSNATNKRFVGFIAQQVESVVPEAVQLIDGILHVDYQALIPYMSEAVKQNYRDIAQRRSESDGMRSVLNTLYTEYTTADHYTHYVPEHPVQKYHKTTTSLKKPKKSTPKWQWFIYAVLAVVLFAAGGALVYFLRPAPQGPPMQHLSPSTKPIDVTPLSNATMPPIMDDPRDRQALIDLYHATNGKNWVYAGGWLTGTSICHWTGVSCVNSTRVKSVNLRTYGLSGTIPESIANLTELNALDLSYNSITGAIPKSIGSMMQLNSLILGNNDISGTIPAELSQLYQTLLWLDVSNNRNLTGEFPQWLPSFAVVTNVYFQNCALYGTVPDYGQMPKLWDLDISGNYLTGTLPTVTNMLFSFHGSNNQFEGSIPKFRNVQILGLNNNRFNGTIDNIRRLGLNYFNLSNNNLTGEANGAFMGYFVDLYLENNNFTSLSSEPPRALKYNCNLSRNSFVCPLPDWAIQCQATCK